MSRAAIVGVLAVGVACSEPARSSESRTVVSVAAASSLTEAFSALETAYETAHPRTDVRLSFAGSQVLRLQVEQGAPFDVFASANEGHVRALAESGTVVDARPFAANRLVIIVSSNAAGTVSSFEDLPQAARIVVGTPEVPVGQYTRRLFHNAENAVGARFVAAVRANIVSMESNVRLVRAKVELGEADAAIVYGTDAVVSGVRTVSVPDHLNVRAQYWLARVPRKTDARPARRFVEWVRSAAGRTILERFGFDTSEP